jgi:hypothetical protein
VRKVREADASRAFQYVDILAICPGTTGNCSENTEEGDLAAGQIDIDKETGLWHSIEIGRSTMLKLV